jgi:hypothetical protein
LYLARSRSARPLPRGFAFYVAFPKSSIVSFTTHAFGKVRRKKEKLRTRRSGHRDQRNALRLTHSTRSGQALPGTGVFGYCISRGWHSESVREQAAVTARVELDAS